MATRNSGSSRNPAKDIAHDAAGGCVNGVGLGAVDGHFQNSATALGLDRVCSCHGPHADQGIDCDCAVRQDEQRIDVKLFQRCFG